MSTVRIRLEPAGVTMESPRGRPLLSLLFEHGVEFPCGGRGTCKACRVRILQGVAPPAPEDMAALGPELAAEGWRLACRLRPETDLVLEVEQWETLILTGTRAIAGAYREGRGVAVDLGTTTIVAELVDLASGNVLGLRSALNPQAVYGSDVMSRVEAAVRRGEGPVLRALIRDRIGELVRELVRVHGTASEIVIAGNTVMHHLFCGYDLSGLAGVPFETSFGEQAIFEARELGWEFTASTQVRVLPCLGGFVGGDILAGILATKIHESEKLAALIDLGTNGEIVIGSRQGLLCASTAAGPAFEGGAISMGMRATTGAIYEVTLDNGQPHCKVIGDVAPRGICGSGLVDAVAAGLEMGVVTPAGRLGSPWELCPPVRLVQSDIRQLQLAKAAVAAGMRILLRRLGASPFDVGRVYLAGAFGNYISAVSARRIGLFEFPLTVIEPAGNTALAGARLALLQPDERGYQHLRRLVEHVPLAADADFEQDYVASLSFPASVD